jgi:hypothetical protein
VHIIICGWDQGYVRVIMCGLDVVCMCGEGVGTRC